MLIYRIRNWAKFQHFKDRRPPWVKLYRDVLDDMEWHDLDPAASKVLVMLWLIASEDDGKLPDAKKLAFRLRMSEEGVTDALSKLSHWLEQVDITGEIIPISERYQDDPLETERETETEKRQKAPAAPRAPRKTALPKDFAISDSVREWAKEHGHGNLDAHLDAFIRKATMKGYSYVNWDMAFMEAVRENWAKLPAINGVGQSHDARYVN